MAAARQRGEHEGEAVFGRLNRKICWTLVTSWLGERQSGALDASRHVKCDVLVIYFGRRAKVVCEVTA
jgi:hypothetical protein